MRADSTVVRMAVSRVEMRVDLKVMVLEKVEMKVELKAVRKVEKTKKALH